MLGPSEREIVAYEESRRFEAFEQRAYAFETAYIDFLIATRARVAPGKLLGVAVKAATRASGMGLYRDTEAGRVTESSRILGIVQDTGQRPSDDVLASIALNYRVRRLRLL
jgi:hypothetical protein